jgi:hypothetical protein
MRKNKNKLLGAEGAHEMYVARHIKYLGEGGQTLRFMRKKKLIIFL